MDIDRRRLAIANLVHLRVPVAEGIRAVQSFPWDSEKELVTLGAAELKTALGRFVNGDLSAGDLEAWANGIEGRDDIEFIPREIIDLVTEIANPLLFSPLNEDTARDLLSRIDALPTP